MVRGLPQQDRIKQTKVANLRECHPWYEREWLLLFVGLDAPDEMHVGAGLQLRDERADFVADLPPEKPLFGLASLAQPLFVGLEDLPH